MCGAMTTDDCIKFFGSKAKLAEALGIEAPSVYSWGEHPPPLRQLQLEAVTGRKLRAEPGLLPKKADQPLRAKVA